MSGALIRDLVVVQTRGLKLPVTVYERGRVGEYLYRWGHVRLFSPFGMNATPLGRAALRAENPKHELPADSDCVTVPVFSSTV